MAYRFKLTETFVDGVRRIGHEQIDRALAQIDEAPVATAVHETRKALKRLRALVRLVRPGLGEQAFTRHNARLRDIGRMLSGSRDRTVMIATLAELAGREPHLADAAAALQQQLAEATDNGQGEEPGGQLSQARKALAKARRDWGALRLESDGFAPLAKGLEKTFERCAAGMAAAYSSQDDADFHAWRKSIQQHWRQMRLVGNAWPEYFEARAAQARELSELLGAAQDLSVLIAYVDAGADHRVDPRALAGLRNAAIKRQRLLREAARPRGARLCAEGPGGFARRAAVYWETAAEMLHAPLAVADAAPSRPSKAANGKSSSASGRSRPAASPRARRARPAPARD